jgi:hypothetical protein
MRVNDEADKVKKGRFVWLFQRIAVTLHSNSVKTMVQRHSKEKFMVYDRWAKKGSPTYSLKPHSAPHFEGKRDTGLEEWANHYCFNRKEDGTYEAELDEGWDEGSHYGGGTIHVDVEKGWFELPYDEFLQNVLKLAAATHYGFTLEDLKEKEGLKEFFGF